MIPREEHLKQVNRFHDMLESVDKKIEKSKKEGLYPQNEYLMYFKLSSNVWPFVDDCIEQIKDKLDEFERDSI